MKIALFLCALLLACSRAELKDPAQAYHLGAAPRNLRDSLDLGSLRMALERNIKAMEGRSSVIPLQYAFGDRIVGREEYLRALKALRPETESWDRFLAFVKTNFEFYEVYGNKKFGSVFSTGYYDPVVEGSLFPTEKLSRPLYKTPSDLVLIDLQAYGERNPGLAPLQNLIAEQRSPRAAWRGRFIADQKKVVPYYLRAEIDGLAKPLSNQKLELAYLDPVDAFFLEIQGSGIVRLTDGKKMRLGYAAQNGAPYLPIGKFLTDKIPLAQMSMQRIRGYLAGLSSAERDQVLFKNLSYVFFQALPGEALTYSGAEVTAGRTIATDRGLYPKGVLAFYEIEEPSFADPQSLDPSAWEAMPRFVFDQDTGGAIRGGGRVDLYMGESPEAARKAGVMKRDGRLWGLAPKAEFLASLKKDSGS